MKKGRKFGAIILLNSALWCMLLSLSLNFFGGGRTSSSQVFFCQLYPVSELVFVSAQGADAMPALLLEGPGWVIFHLGQVAWTNTPSLAPTILCVHVPLLCHVCTSCVSSEVQLETVAIWGACGGRYLLKLLTSTEL